MEVHGLFIGDVTSAALSFETTSNTLHNFFQETQPKSISQSSNLLKDILLCIDLLFINMPTLVNPASSSTTSITTSQETLPVQVPPSIRLVLRAEPAEERHIQWAEDVIDNEGMGKKSSKGKFCFSSNHPPANTSVESKNNYR